MGPTGATVAATSNTGGNAFDTCAAPTAAQMQSWLSSPYRSLGIYIGGTARGCAQPNLTRGWVSTVTGQGWGLLPIYVGLQAPCYGGTKPMSSTPSAASTQGYNAGVDAANQMTALGLAATSPVYLDIENYDPANAACVAAVKAFTNSWTSVLHARGRLAGIYGSTNSMITNLVGWRSDSGYHQPDDIWLARWNGSPTTDDSTVPPDAWSGHRIHQFAGGHSETWGGVTLSIDSDVTSASRFTPLWPTRLYDSVSASIGTTPVPLYVAGKAGVPAGATAVEATVSVINPTAAGSLIVTPYLSTSTVAVQQFTAGRSISATVIVPLHRSDIQFRLTAGKARVTVTVVGYLSTTAGSRVTALTPTRLYDSVSARIGTTTVPLRVAGRAGVPSNATAVAAVISVINPTATGSLIVTSYRSTATAATQQFSAGRNVSATVMVPLNASDIQFRLNAGKARVIVTVIGYVAPTGSSMTAVVPSTLYDSVSARIGTGTVPLHVSGRAGVPSTAKAVIATVSVINPTVTGSLIVAPYQSTATAGMQQFVAGQSVSTTVIVPLHLADIQFRLNAGKARVIVAVTGYLT